MHFWRLCVLMGIAFGGIQVFPTILYSQMAAHTDPALPVTLTEATIPDQQAPLVLFISGDGGWTKFDQRICDQLAIIGMSTVGLDARKYFWNYRSPEATARDIAQLLQTYGEQWGRKKYLLIGYSMGAEVLPFIFEKLPAELKARTESLVLLSPEPYGDFEVHLANLIGLPTKKNTFDVVAVVKKISAQVPVLIILGKDEKSLLATAFPNDRVRFTLVSGDHHYNNDAAVILKAIKNRVP